MLNEKCVQAIQSVERTLELLELLASKGDRLTIRAVADRLGLGHREVRLMLVALESREFVCWDEKARVYRAGRATIEMASRFNSRLDTAPAKQVEAAKPRQLRGSGNGSERRYGSSAII